MPTMTISIDEEVREVIAKRAKKNLLTVKEQVEEIVRQSAVRTKSGESASQLKADDRLVDIFSRQRPGKKKRKN